MALSEELKKRIRVAITDEATADELIAAIQASVASPAGDVADNSPASADTINLSTSDTYSDAAVNSAVNTALAAVVADINADRLQINAILDSLRAAGLMS